MTLGTRAQRTHRPAAPAKASRQASQGRFCVSGASETRSPWDDSRRCLPGGHSPLLSLLVPRRALAHLENFLSLQGPGAFPVKPALLAVTARATWVTLTSIPCDITTGNNVSVCRWTFRVPFPLEGGELPVAGTVLTAPRAQHTDVLAAAWRVKEPTKDHVPAPRGRRPAQRRARRHPTGKAERASASGSAAATLFLP